MENRYFISDTKEVLTSWQSIWRINISVVKLKKVKLRGNLYEEVLFQLCLEKIKLHRNLYGTMAQEGHSAVLIFKVQF